MNLKLLTLIATAFLLSCSLSSRIGNRLPKTTKDSLTVAKLCSAVYPIDTTTKTELVIVNPGIDSSEYFKHIADSLSAIEPTVLVEVETKYRDTCTSAVAIYKEGKSRGYAEGFNAGRSKPVHDTITYLRTLTLESTSKLKAVEIEREYAKKETAKEHGRVILWRALFLIFLCLFILLLVAGFLIGKRSIKINDTLHVIKPK